MRRSTKLAAALAAGIFSLAATACSSDDSEGTAGEETSGAPTSDIKVGLAYDIGGRGDQSFNDMAAAGLDKAKAEFGLEAQESDAADGEDDAAKVERLTQLAEAGYNPVIAVGFAYSAPLGEVAPQFPDTTFAIVDDASLADAENVASLVFAEEQGSFLVGAAAALKSQANHIGFVGGVNVPLIHKFEAGFEAGAKAVKPDITIESQYLTEPPDFSGFGDPAKGKTAAEGMFDAGADIVFHAAGGSGLGVFQAAKAAGGLGIGVDSDQYNTVPEDLQPVVMTSMLKKVDVAVYDYIKSFVDGDPLSGPVVFDLEKNGVDYSRTGGQVDDIADQIDEYKQKIIDGEITVPEK